MVTATTGVLVSLLERLLHDPWGTLADLIRQLGGWVAGWGLRLLLLGIPLWLGWVVVWGWRRWRQQRLAAGARLVGILVPPQPEP
jgi:hypothetical protein